jgi:hypothetical protein
MDALIVATLTVLAFTLIARSIPAPPKPAAYSMLSARERRAMRAVPRRMERGGASLGFFFRFF